MVDEPDDFDEDNGPPTPPEPPLRDPVRKPVARVQPLPRVPQYRPPEDPTMEKARYHISEIPGYQGLADASGEPVWDGNPNDGTAPKGPLSR